MSAAEREATWVFGGSSPLGQALLRDLTVRSKVLCFGRKPPDGAAEFRQLDLSRPDQVATALGRAYAEYPPAGVVFCQRYRPTAGISGLEAIQQGVAVELGPLLSLVELVETDPRPIALRSLVLLTSVAGRQSHPDVPVHYHVLKAAALAACRSVTHRLAPRGVRINCLVLGEFLKSPRSSYPDCKLRQFSAIERFTPGSRICNPEDISHAVRFLLSDEAAFVTGQELTLDGGISLLGAESLIRTGVAST